MSLILPPFQFANVTDSFSGTPSATPGVTFTAGANNADGAAVSVLSALAHDAHLLEISVALTTVSAVASFCLLDVLIDPAGGTSWSSFIDDLVCGFSPNTNAAPCLYRFPIFVPAGASLGVRCRTSHTVDITGCKVTMRASGNPSRPDLWWCGGAVESLGVSPSTSKGTVVTPGASGTYGSWTSIGSATSARYGSLQFGTNGTSATAAAKAYHWQVGYGSTQLPGSPVFWELLNTSELTNRVFGFGLPIFCDIASGTQMQARATCSTTSPEDGNVAIYGVY